MFKSYNASIKAKINPGEKYEQLILAAEICHGEVSKIGSSSKVKMMTDEGAVDIMREDGCFMVNREMPRRPRSLSGKEQLMVVENPESKDKFNVYHWHPAQILG